MLRVNQKVECIVQDHEWQDRVPCYEFPVYRTVYEIRGIREHPDGTCYLLLREIINPKPCSCRMHESEPAFIAEAFRPLISDEVKNEHVIKIVDQAKRMLERKRERAWYQDRIEREQRERAYWQMKEALRARGATQ